MATFPVLDQDEYFLDPFFIFDFLLPPIILDSAYKIYSRQFFYNMDGILLMAFVGTSLNIIMIGGAIYLFYGIFDGQLELDQSFLLASIISAVDPVAVLTVFEEVGVQQSLYCLIFGEALLNDAITVVVFEGVNHITFVEVADMTYLYAVLSFLTVCIGGILIGIFVGMFTAFVTKHTNSPHFHLVLIIVTAFVAHR